MGQKINYVAASYADTAATGMGVVADQAATRGVASKFDLGGYKWVKQTKQPHKKFKVD